MLVTRDGLLSHITTAISYIILRNQTIPNCYYLGELYITPVNIFTWLSQYYWMRYSGIVTQNFAKIEYYRLDITFILYPFPVVNQLGDWVTIVEALQRSVLFISTNLFISIIIGNVLPINATRVFVLNGVRVECNLGSCETTRCSGILW